MCDVGQPRGRRGKNEAPGTESARGGYACGEEREGGGREETREFARPVGLARGVARRPEPEGYACGGEHSRRVLWWTKRMQACGSAWAGRSEETEW